MHTGCCHRRVIPVLLSSLALASPTGCGGTKDPLAWQKQAAAQLKPVIAKHRAAAEAQLAAITRVGAAALVALPITEPTGDQLPAQLTITTFSTEDSQPGDTLLISAERAATPTGAVTHKVSLVPGHSLLGSTARLLDAGWYDGAPNAKATEQQFTALQALRYALVVRVRDYTAPSATVRGGTLRFTPARARGDAALYTIQDRSVMASFPFDIVQSDRATTTTTATDDQLVRELEQSFASDFRHALTRQFEQLRAGTLPKAGNSSAHQQRTQYESKLVVELSQNYLAALVAKVDLTTEEEVLIATIHASSPSVLANAAGAPLPKVVDLVRQVTGNDTATVRVVKATD